MTDLPPQLPRNSLNHHWINYLTKSPLLNRWCNNLLKTLKNTISSKSNNSSWLIWLKIIRSSSNQLHLKRQAANNSNINSINKRNPSPKKRKIPNSQLTKIWQVQVLQVWTWLIFHLGRRNQFLTNSRRQWPNRARLQVSNRRQPPSRQPSITLQAQSSPSPSNRQCPHKG